MVDDGTLAVLNIYIDEDLGEWFKYMSVYPGKWYNGYDHNHIIRDDTLYDVRAIPSLYLLDRDKKVIMTTSMNPGSGKSFITSNLACCMSLKKKRVIAIDLDLRRAALSQIVNSPKFGIVNYLNGEANDWRKTIVKVEGFKSFDVIPVGSIPPNPTELLFNGEYLKTMIEDLKKEYDYVFLDCPPVDVVADAGIVSEFADMTLFVVRAGLLEKHMLPNIDSLYASKKYPSMSLVLNATGAKGTYGYGYGYTYGSSYGYASGYGYGYNKYISNEEN